MTLTSGRMATTLLVAVLAAPAVLWGETGTPVAQNQQPTATSDSNSAQAGQQQATSESKKEAKKEKKAKKKKVACVSPPPGSGEIDYCKNPYWEPKDWIYIMQNGSGGGGRN